MALIGLPGTAIADACVMRVRAQEFCYCSRRALLLISLCKLSAFVMEQRSH